MEKKEKSAHDLIREEYRNKRRELSVDDCVRFSQLITKNFLSYWRLSNKLIHCFLPIHRLKEVDTVPLIRSLNEHNRICVPVANFTIDSMKHKLLDDNTLFEENSMGILQPINGVEVSPKEIDYVIVPLLAVDRFGNRLGYGKGFYDRFLVECSPSCTFIGVSMFDIHEDFEDMQPHDVPLHFVVTPKGIQKTGRKPKVANNEN